MGKKCSEQIPTKKKVGVDTVISNKIVSKAKIISRDRWLPE